MSIRPDPASQLARDQHALRVGIIAPPWLPVPPTAYGGTENVLDILARGLQAAGVDVVLFTTGDATCSVPRKWVFPDAIGVGNGGAAEEARHVIGAYQQLRDVDVIHDHTIVGPLYAQGIESPPVLTTNHGPFNGILAPLYRAVSAHTPVIAISHHQASTAIGTSIAAVIHHGIDVERIPFGSGGGGYAAFLGRMHPDKGVEEAIAAARAAGIPLRIAAKMSEPAEREYFASRVAPHLGDDVEYQGELSRNEKYDFLKEAVCLLNPIRWAEPFGMVMIEALACGTPIVTNGQGSACEIVDEGETGYLCGGLGSRVRALQKVETLDRSRCRAVAEQRFSSHRMVAGHIATYRRTIEGISEYRDTAAHAPVAHTRKAPESSRPGHRSLQPWKSTSVA